MKNNRQDCLFIKYEDLFSNSNDTRVNTLKKILNFTKINVDDSEFNYLVNESFNKKNKTKKLIFKEFKNWKIEDQREFEKLTKNMRNKLNY